MSFIAAAIIGGGAIIGGVISASGAKSAANTQANAAENAQQISENEFNTITGQEKPFMDAGTGALSALDYGLGTGPNIAPAGGSAGMGYGSLTKPFTTSDFQSLSPAYNFQLEQGQQGVRNADSAAGGAMGGAALKDLTDYNQAEANTSFNNAFNQYQTQQGNIFSRLSGIANLGQNAASNTGAQGTALAGQAAQSATNVGTAQAAGTVGAANAISGSISSATPWLAGSASRTTNPNSSPSNWDTENPSNFTDFIPTG